MKIEPGKEYVTSCGRRVYDVSKNTTGSYSPFMAKIEGIPRETKHDKWFMSKSGKFLGVKGIDYQIVGLYSNTKGDNAEQKHALKHENLKVGDTLKTSCGAKATITKITNLGFYALINTNTLKDVSPSFIGACNTGFDWYVNSDFELHAGNMETLRFTEYWDDGVSINDHQRDEHVGAETKTKPNHNTTTLKGTKDMSKTQIKPDVAAAMIDPSIQVIKGHDINFDYFKAMVRTKDLPRFKIPYLKSNTIEDGDSITVTTLKEGTGKPVSISKIEVIAKNDYPNEFPSGLPARWASGFKRASAIQKHFNKSNKKLAKKTAKMSGQSISSNATNQMLIDAGFNPRRSLISYANPLGWLGTGNSIWSKGRRLIVGLALAGGIYNSAPMINDFGVSTYEWGMEQLQNVFAEPTDGSVKYVNATPSSRDSVHH